jgi:mono/diheme cytochrome c family protein
MKNGVRMFRALVLSNVIMASVVAPRVHASDLDPTLTIKIGKTVRSLKASQLLAYPDLADITIPKDVAYKRQMTYKAIPLLSVLPAEKDIDFDTLEVRATDGFVSQLPVALIKRAKSGGASAWIAIEPPGQPWPKIAGKDISAGPFFVVWKFPKKSNIGPEQWPYAVAEFRSVRSPVQRWPQLAVQSNNADARKGMAVYLKHCLSCHKIAKAGEATMGPDLAYPMSPTTYMTEIGLRGIIRNPTSVRTWPKQEMAGFSVETLPEIELDQLIAYLRYMSRHSAKDTKVK